MKVSPMVLEQGPGKCAFAAWTFIMLTLVMFMMLLLMLFLNVTDKSI